MMTKLVVGVSALVLAGGTFMTAQALSSGGEQLPTINAPLTVQPAGSRTTGPASTAPTSPAATSPTTTGVCRDDDSPYAEDHHGRGSDDSSSHRCEGLPTVVPSPSVFTDDHGGQGETEPGDDHGGSGGGSDDHSGSDDQGGSGSDGGGDDHGGRG
jgi:hypothetical protein